MSTKKQSRKASLGKGMTLTQLASRTTRDRIERAQHVKVLKTKLGHNTDGNGFIAAQTTTVRKVDDKGRLVRYRGPKYVSLIVFFDNQLHVRVSCSCADNLFRWEVANTRRKASEIEYSNGEFPVFTNPRGNPGLCLDGNSLIATSFGYKKICNVTTKDKVYTLDGLKRVLASEQTGENRSVLHFKTHSGRFLKVTPEHIMYVVRDHQLIEVEAQDVVQSDNFVVGLSHTSDKNKKIKPFIPTIPNGNSFNVIHDYPVEVTEDLARLLGYLLAEGSACGFFSNSDALLRKDFVRCLISCFGTDVPYTEREDGVHIYKGVLQFLKHLGLVWGSYKLRAPKIILQGTPNIITEFLYGYMAGDGHLTDQYFTIGTASRRMAQDLLLLLSSLDVFATANVGRTGHANTLLWRVRAQSLDARKLCELFNYPHWVHTAYSRAGIETDGTLMFRNVLPFTSASYCDYLLKQQLHKEDSQLLADRGNKYVRITLTLNEWQDSSRTDFSSLVAKLKANDCPIVYKSPKGWKGKPFGYAKVKDLLDVSFFHRFVKRQRIQRKQLASNKGMWSTCYKYKFARIAKKLNIDTSFWQRDDIVFDKIVSIKTTTSQRVYDLTVEDNSQFFANGILTHNCKHLFALYTSIKSKIER